MGLLDSLSWENLQSAKDSAAGWLSSTADAQVQYVKAGFWTLLSKSRSAVEEAAEGVKEFVVVSALPVTNPANEVLSSIGAYRHSFLTSYAFPYRFNMLVLPLGLLMLTGKGVRPKLFRLVAFGVPGAALLTPEVNPFNRK